MSLAIIYSRAHLGIDAPLITVEVHLSNGLPGLSIVGMPEAVVKESKDRVRSALINSHFDFPAKRITINLAPADLPKEGSRFDLPIAIGILVASEQIPIAGLEQFEFIGELALSGELRKVNAILPSAIATARAQRQLMVAMTNASEAALCDHGVVYGANNLLDVCHHLQGAKSLAAVAASPPVAREPMHDIADVKGQSFAKRALEITAAGRHNLLFHGSPGTGKTMLASRLPGIMPPLTTKQAIRVASIYSLCGYQYKPWGLPPFRCPHHTASAVALVGGGSQPKPGEISLADNGVLFLDELPEFQRQVLEVLREPIESGEIRISRASAQVTFPANFQLVAAMNPCPCGYLNSPVKQHCCRCSPDKIKRYRQKISGPLLDRIDLHVAVNGISMRELQCKGAEEKSIAVRQRVLEAHSIQMHRQKKSNAHLSKNELEQYCPLNKKTQHFYSHAIEKLGLSARAYDRILKVSRTIADLSGETSIQQIHISEALAFRQFDNN